MTTDPLNDALREATLAVLLGSTTVPSQTIGPDGSPTFMGTVTIRSAFEERLRSQALQGTFDDLLREAMTKVDTDAVARALEGLLADQFIQGLERVQTSWGGRSDPNWLQARSRDIAVAATTAALAADEALLETLRARIGMEVDRNKVSIAVQLTDPES